MTSDDIISLIMYKKIGLFITALDSILGLYFFLYKGYVDGMAFLIITLYSVVVSSILGVLFCFFQKTRTIGYLLVANVVFLPLIFFVSASVGSSITKYKESKNDITYTFSHKGCHHKLTMYAKNKFGMYSNTFVLKKSGHDNFWSYLTGSYYLKGENNFLLVPDSTYHNKVRKNKTNMNDVYFCCDTIILRNDTLIGLYPLPIYMKKKVLCRFF